jgi:hypothetical protein
MPDAPKEGQLNRRGSTFIGGLGYWLGCGEAYAKSR